MRAFIVFWNINCEMQFSISFQFLLFFYFFQLLEIPKFGNFWYNIVRTLYFQLKKKKTEKRDPLSCLLSKWNRDSWNSMYDNIMTENTQIFPEMSL